MIAFRLAIIAAMALYLGTFTLNALINGQIATEQAQGELK